jgi:hypothetical protein
MASIPLTEIPNLPASAAPQLESAQSGGDSTYRQIRTSIDDGQGSLNRGFDSVSRGLEANKQSVAQAGMVGEAGVGLGKDISHLSGDVAGMVGVAAEIEKVGAQSQFTTNYNAAKLQLENAKASSDPSQWAGLQKNFNDSYGQTVLQGISPWGQKLLAPDILKRQADDTLSTGLDAHKSWLDGQTENAKLAIQQSLNKGDILTAHVIAEGAAKAGLLNPAQKESYDAYIQGTQEKNGILHLIQTNPEETKDKFEQAISNNKTLPGFPSVTVDELKNYKNQAAAVVNYKATQIQNGLWAKVDSTDPSQKYPNLAALQADPMFKNQGDDDKKALQDRFLNLHNVLGTPEAAQNTLAVKSAIANYDPQKDADFKQYRDITNQAIAGVPPADAHVLIKQLNDIHEDFIKGGGAIDPDKAVVKEAKAEITKIADKTKLFGDPETDPVAVLRKQQDVENAFEKAWADPKQKGNGSIQDARRILDTITQKEQWGKGAAEGLTPAQPGTFQKIKDWMTGAKPQASNDYGSALGKVTSYGYKGDSTPDTNSAAGIGSQNNKLDHSSLAVSPDIEERMKAAGIKQGDKVALKLADGSVVTKTLADRTAKEYKGKPLTGRFDFYSPEGLHPQDGVAVTGFSKAGQS